MRLLTNRKAVISTFLCFFLLSAVSYSQTYRFKNYGIENNLPSEVIYTIIQDHNGYLWVGTTEGLFRFDGIEFFRVQLPDSAGGGYPTVSLKDKNGNLWFGFNDGTLFFTEGTLLKQIVLPNSSGTAISSLLEGPDDKIYAISQRKPLFRIDPARLSGVEIMTLDTDPNIFAGCFTSNGNLLLGTQENLMICKVVEDSVITMNQLEGFDYASVRSLYKIPQSESYIIGTDGSGLYRLRLSNSNAVLSRFGGSADLETLVVRSITGDPENNLWVSAQGTGVLKLHFFSDSDSLSSVSLLTTASGLPGDNTTVVFHDSEENVWIGFNGEGLSMLSSDSFEFNAPGQTTNSNDIIFTGRLKDDYILGTPAGFYVYDMSARKSLSFIPLTTQAGRNGISSYFIDDENNLWIGTRGSGLFLRNDAGIITRVYRSGDSGADFISSIKIYGDRIWMATLNGVNIVSRKTGTLIKNYNINNGLPHNSINQILINEDGSGYIATEGDKLYRIDIDSGIIASGCVMEGVTLNKIFGITKDKRGSVWVATYGNGVFECTGDSVKTFSTANGLLSNYTYSILADNENNIWIGYERGFSKFNIETGIIRSYSTEFARGGSCNMNGLYESPDGKILIGTTEGLIIYDPSKDKRSLAAPVNNINSITINGAVYPYQPSFSLPYRKRYTVKVSYTGIDLSDPEKVYYSTMLENYDDHWTEESSSREVTYNLRDGKYKFKMISVNEEGLSQDNPLSFDIYISRPFWRTWWFILSMAGVASGIVILVVREREKAQKKIQEYLEKELEARTRVVMKQKAELELQNIEITDSINYAKRIQSSILPDINRLKEHFGDAFIMLYPRDIVSGDFYWFDKLDDDRVILACADSTGHGVPGAFMSMIGSTLLQDIVSRQRISKPSEILTMLDKQIFSILNQNLEVGVSNDGMDIVVCEFTLKNRHIRFASAMRPVILVIGGEPYYIKGNRSSVGGQTLLEKYFDDQEYYLNEGDTLYMFSDGMPDQFGGPEGKKMKIARLKNLITEVSGLPIPRQEQEFTKFFKEWKGNYDQVDDILLMGVKI